MAKLSGFIFAGLILLYSFNVFDVSGDPVNGGFGCAVCTLMVALSSQVAEVRNQDVAHVVQNICTWLPGKYQLLCEILLHIWGDAVAEKLDNGESPDVICHSLGVCRRDAGHDYCHLFPLPENGLEEAIAESRNRSRIAPHFNWAVVEKMRSVCDLPAVRTVCDYVTRAYGSYDPSIDIDRDKFSVVKSMRGSDWRGKDCDDTDEFVYPGRRPQDGDQYFDSNCNGIFGINPESNNTYEDDFCKTTGSRGLIYIGDSIGAHFHVPKQWFTPAEINRDIFANISTILGNQLDWPQMSFTTGHSNLHWPVIDGEIDSIYTKIRRHNLCNHRDYQNICFNGAATDTMLSTLSTVARDKNLDKPTLVLYGLMGNDVCARYMEHPEDLTTPDQFTSNVLESLELLNRILPEGSHVVLIGLVDGSFIYPSMAQHLHPLGQLRKDVKYHDIYKWFNCMHIGPCFGWLNEDENFRNATSERAEELTRSLISIAENKTYTSFDLHFVPNPLKEVLEKWEEMGFEKWQAMEPVDSMHPVQELQPLIAEVLWNELETKFPEVLGETNPFNEMISQIFGDQGGH